MRVTNSMLITGFLHNLNNNMNRLSKLQGQMTSGKVYEHVSDDPIAVIYSQQATQRLRRLELYQKNVDTADSWLTSAESGMMELNEILKKALEATTDAATDVKTDEDKNNIAVYISQLRDQVVSALNSAFGLKHVFGGYDTTGYNTADGGISPPFTVKDGNLCYNGVDLTDPANSEVIEKLRADVLTFDLGLGIDMDVTINGVDAAIFGVEYDASGNVAKYNNLYNLLDDLYNAMSKGEKVSDLLGGISDALAGGELTDNVNSKLDTLQAALKDTKWDPIRSLLDDMADTRLKQGQINDLLGQLRDALQGGRPTDPDEETAWINRIDGLLTSLSGSTAGLSTAPASIATTIASLQAALPSGTLGTINSLFGALRLDFESIDWGTEVKDKFDALEAGLQGMGNEIFDSYVSPSAEKIGSYISEMQAAQEYLLGHVADIGGKTNRLELLASRYSQDEINYYQMLSDAEDADEAEVIMNFKMAEAVYNAALAAGASIIQPTLMDFLR